MTDKRKTKKVYISKEVKELKRVRRVLVVLSVTKHIDQKFSEERTETVPMTPKDQSET